MRGYLGLAVIAALAAAPLHAQTVYRCKTAQGVVYSQRPCAPDAEKREMQPTRRANPVAGETITMAALDGIFMVSEKDVVDRIGQPAARYRVGDDEYWLYPNACRLDGQQRVCAELLIREGASQQVNWLAEATMRKSVRVAQDIGSWKPPLSPPQRAFTIQGIDAVGRTRAMIAHKYGPPDVKRIDNGAEVWEYRGIQTSRIDTTPATLLIEFDGDKVKRISGG